MTDLQQNYLKNNSELNSDSQNINCSVVLQATKNHGEKKNQFVSKSAAFESAGDRDAHDFTEIMGYKNIDISRDVDQSYMLKGS
jgi:hypothetical protein